MLTQLSQGIEPSDFILVTDKLFVSGWDLFYLFLTNFAKKYDKIHVFLFEKLKFEFLEGLLPHVKESIVFHDFVSDPLGWIDPESSNRVPNDFRLAKIIGNITGNTAIVFDSITTLLRHIDIQRLCFNIQEIQQTSQKNGGRITILGLLHRDICKEEICKSVEFMASSVVSLVTEKEVNRVGNKAEDRDHSTPNLCKIINKKKNGKVTESIETFSIVKGSLVNVKPWTPVKRIKDADDVLDEFTNKEEDVVTSTFNLSLSSQEKEARSKLVLPYMKPQHLQVKLDDGKLSSQKDSFGSQQNVNPGGFIYYEPDEADDFDDEDPDDDLDF